MTHDSNDFDSLFTPVKTHIETANGELVAIQGGGSIVFSEKLKLKIVSMFLHYHQNYFL